VPFKIHREVAERVRELELPFNRFGIDPYGVSRRHLAQAFSWLAFFYTRYFDVRVHNVGAVPPRGRAMLVGNHSGGVALDAATVLGAMLLEMTPPRLAHSMAEKFLASVPFMSEWMRRCGQLTGLPEHAVRLLEDDRLLLVFPEGARGTAKLYPDRHSLVRFGTGFMRLALQTAAPIVPFAFLGGGEAIPTVYNSAWLGKLLGAPYVPMTPYLLTLPLPVRLDIVFGEPLLLQGDGQEDDEIIAVKVEQVRQTIADLIARGRQLRRGQLTEREEGRG